MADRKKKSNRIFHVPSKDRYIELKLHASGLISVFGSTYLCEKTFSKIRYTSPLLSSSLLHGRRSNQSILKEISPGCSLEGMMLKLKLQYFSHLVRRVDSLERTLMLGGIGGRRRRGRQRMR